eukprot:s828_g16.t1
MEKSLLAPDLRPGVYHEISRFPDHVESCQRQEVPVLVSSSMWFLAVISMALAVNWEALVRHYRAWQRQHGVFTLTGREAGRRDVEPV